MQRRIISIILATCFTVVGMLVGFTLKEGISATSTGRQHSSSSGKLDEVIKYLQDNYFEEVDKEKLVDDAINGMLQKLDPHTFYIPAEELKSINEQMEGSFEGIGIEFNILNDTLLVVSPLSGGPSERVGIEAGDRIIQVDGEDISGTGLTNNDVVKKLRGKKGTKVKVAIKRGGYAELMNFEIIRDKIPIHSIDFAYMLDSETGYIKVNRFAGNTFQEFVEHSQKLKEQGMQNLILDLRNNPGGYLDQAFYLADLFLEKDKMIVYTEGRLPSTNKQYRATSSINAMEKGGLVVLINEGSASASEIVSGAVQDWDRGLILGTRSFGKGLVQQQYVLNDESAVRIVVSRYFTPSGRCIQKPFSKDDKDYESEILKRYESGEIFNEELISLPDSLKYKTNAGRTVYGGGAIMPDVYIPPDTSGRSKYLTKIFTKNILNSFAMQYADGHREEKDLYKNGFEFSKSYKIKDQLLKEFTVYANGKDVAFDPEGFEASKEFIKLRIKALLGRTWFGDEGLYPVLHAEDEVLKQGLKLMPNAIKLQKTGKFSNR